MQKLDTMSLHIDFKTKQTQLRGYLSPSGSTLAYVALTFEGQLFFVVLSLLFVGPSQSVRPPVDSGNSEELSEGGQSALPDLWSKRLQPCMWWDTIWALAWFSVLTDG